MDKPDYNPRDFDSTGLQLLGARQAEFLRAWGQSWKGATIKTVVSQTLFSMGSTHHGPGKTFHYCNFDANGWPQTPRNRAVDLLRQCYALQLCGDQHLASIMQYGIDDRRDAGWAFCVPSIANLYPRWWEPKTPGQNPEPGAQPFTGDFLDGFGNRTSVYAHTNPRPSGREPKELHDRMPGYGIVRFNNTTRDITMECWPRMIDPTDPKSRQYTGWPRTINQLDNYGRNPVAWLPKLQTTGMESPIVQIIADDTKEIVYTLRIKGASFQPKVFKPGTYTIKVGDPDRNKWNTVPRIKAAETSTDTLDINL